MEVAGKMKKLGILFITLVAIALVVSSNKLGSNIDALEKPMQNELITEVQTAPTPLATLPDVHDVTILGQIHSNAETTLCFNDMIIEDKAQFVIDLTQFFQLERCEMCNCNYTNEEMEQLMNVFPNTKFVWIVHCAKWSIRTDAVSFSTMFVDYGWGPETSKDFEPLKYCTDLEALDIGHKSCTDISFIKDLKKLKILILAINKITDISPLEELTNVTYLELFLNNIEDLTPLEKLTNIEYLNLCHNRKLGEIEPILHFPKLKKLWISNCNLTPDEIARIRAAYPNAWLEFNVYESVEAGWREGKVYYPMRNAFNKGIIDPMFIPEEETLELEIAE